MSLNGNGNGSSLASVMQAYKSGTLERARCIPALTPRQIEVCALLSAGIGQEAICAKLGIKPTTLSYHIEEAGMRIPGDLPGATKLIVWFRGGTHQVLGSWRVPVNGGGR